jgi:hypothetical protein
MVLLPVVARAEGRSLKIIYTGSMDGELESCGCSPKTDFGGVARLSGYLKEHKNDLYPYILIDGGNFSFKDTQQGRLKAEAMLESFSIMKYDAVAFLKNEKAFPDDFFPPLLDELNIPAISDTPQYKISFSVKRKDVNVNISVDPGRHQKGELNILLTDLPVSETKLIEGWDIIINSSGEILNEPLRINGRIIVTGYPKGRNLGILTLQIDGKGKVSDFNHRWQPLGDDIKEDAEVRKILNDYDSKVAGLLKEAERPPAGTTYLGVAKCAECHQLFEESWKKTRHSGAFSSLEHAGKSNDPECIICHVVGFGEDGGFYSINTTPELANVQCEECHGLDREHIEDFSRPVKPVIKDVCLKCHTKENSPDFDYPVYLEKIIH